MRFCHPTVLAAVALTAGCPGCPDTPPPAAPARDAAADVPRDAPARGARRRRRSRVRVASADPQRNARAAAEPASDDNAAEEPGPRPRITETGPMLPEDLGPPPEVSYDMGAGGEGPMGLTPSQVSRGLDPLMGRLGTCAAATTDDQGRGPHGRVGVRLRIRSDGRPAAARVSGGGGPPEFVTCVRRVVASARFESFRGPDVIVSWGFDVE